MRCIFIKLLEKTDHKLLESTLASQFFLALELNLSHDTMWWKMDLRRLSASVWLIVYLYLQIIGELYFPPSVETH